MSLKYQLAVFDVDGTLADSLPRLFDVWNRLAVQYNFRPIAKEDRHELHRLSTSSLLKHLKIPIWKLPGIVRQVRRQMAKEVDRVSLFPGVEEMLQRLIQHGMRISIVSSNSLENIQRILGPQNSQMFDSMECSASLFGKRPKLRKVLKKSNVDPARAIYIGDEVRDLLAARAEHMAFGAVTWGYASRQMFLSHAPQEIFDSLLELGDRLTDPDTALVRKVT